MKHLLSFFVICNIHLVAGLPRLYIDDDSTSILQKPDVKLIPRANTKASNSKGSQSEIGQKMPPTVPLLPKQEPKTALAIHNKQAGSASQTQKQSKVGLRWLPEQRKTDSLSKEG